MPLFDTCQVIYEQACFNNYNYNLIKLHDISFIKYKHGDIIVGSVELTRAFIRKNIDRNFKFINTYPEELKDYYYRDISKIKLKDYKGDSFIKPVDSKLFDGGFRDIYDIELEMGAKIDEIGDTECYISSKIDIITEYRCFVYNNKLAGIHYYSGNPLNSARFVDLVRIIKGFKNAPIAYCLDIGVIDKGGNHKIAVIEVNDILASGTYGYSYKLINMYFDRFNEIRG